MSQEQLSEKDKETLQALIEELDNEMEALTSDVKKFKEDVTAYKHKEDVKRVLNNILSLKE